MLRKLRLRLLGRPNPRRCSGILSALAERTPQTTRELALALHTTPFLVLKDARHLRAQGHVKIMRDPQDRARVFIGRTAARSSPPASTEPGSPGRAGP